MYKVESEKFLRFGRMVHGDRKSKSKKGHLWSQGIDVSKIFIYCKKQTGNGEAANTGNNFILMHLQSNRCGMFTKILLSSSKYYIV